VLKQGKYGGSLREQAFAKNREVNAEAMTEGLSVIKKKTPAGNRGVPSEEGGEPTNGHG